MRLVWPFLLLLAAVLAIEETSADEDDTNFMFLFKLIWYKNTYGKKADGSCCDKRDKTKGCKGPDTCDLVFRRCVGWYEQDCSIMPKTQTPVVKPNATEIGFPSVIRDGNLSQNRTLIAYSKIKTTSYHFHVQLGIYDDDNGKLQTIRYLYKDAGIIRIKPYYVKNLGLRELNSHLVGKADGYIVFGLGAMCKPYRYGSTCSIYCKEDDTNVKSCSRQGKKTCHPHYYGTNCDVHCDPPQNYNCTVNGSLICDSYHKGDQCKECIDDHYGEGCLVVCKETDRYTCLDSGLIQCKTNYYGKNCSVECKETDRYTCLDSGLIQCKTNYYGKNCSFFCDDVLQKHVCQHDGTRQCLGGWSGRLCDDDFITCKDDQSFKTAVFNQIIQVWFKYYKNYNGTLANGQCCDHKDAQVCPSNQCDTSFYLYGIRGDDDQDCFNLPSQYFPPTTDSDAFSVFGRNEKEEHPPLALKSFVLPFSNKPTKFKVTAYDEDESPELGEDIAAWNFKVDWSDPMYLGNSPKWRKLTLPSATAELTVWLSSMCSKNYYGDSCSVYCEPSGTHTCGDDGKPVGN